MKLFQIDASSGNSYTYNEVVNRSERLAAGLQELGVHQGDVVCILSPNHIEYPMVIYATALTTAVLQTLNPQTTTGKLIHSNVNINTISIGLPIVLFKGS